MWPRRPESSVAMNTHSAQWHSRIKEAGFFGESTRLQGWVRNTCKMNLKYLTVPGSNDVFQNHEGISKEHKR